MIYANKRGLLSRSLSGYVVADTTNPTGFRPQYTRLGTELSATSRLPNWKAAAGAKDRAARRAAAIANGRARLAMLHAAADDARVRGAHFAGLGALGILDMGTPMSRGYQYVFHFTYSSIAAQLDASSITQKVAGDSNFIGPVASAEGTGFKVQFTYNGQGSSVGQAGAEMQNVLGSFSLFNLTQPGVGATFSYAEGGPPTTTSAGLTLYGVDASGQPVYIDSQGNVSDAQGNVLTDLSSITPLSAISTLGTGNPPPNNNPGAPFNFANFFEGLGTGGAIALVGGIGVLLLLTR